MTYTPLTVNMTQQREIAAIEKTSELARNEGLPGNKLMQNNG